MLPPRHAQRKKIWAKTLPSGRARILSKSADLLEQNGAELILWIMRESGSIYAKASMEIERSALLIRHAASLATAPLGMLSPSMATQGGVASAVSIPVGLSSSILVPFMARLLPAGRSIGLLTYDATKLQERHFNSAGWSSADTPVAIGGIEGSDSWREFAAHVPDISSEMLNRDVMAATSALLPANPSIAVLVFECIGFPLAIDSARKHTGLPVADFVTLGRMLIETTP
ncbi:aldehyde dehydrogenase family protein [Neorhizobium galegae]|uniref:aldehyde dehydrogenase family protein n=1 Tax=Neorhizobium galegae TaxID=399 RepID=UPI00210738C8|nr:aldehyde dehydrogenase family protein [Neorhizobium galegae]MCQ1775284.1 aldehyde dehydrogenase family protein [Neorhizobium galegae]MCQ1781246.1 aldehyde dehydrogenase family protein [Neorhizobium galegae]MCQ1797444.1 aldehyde dehydrogenase family protein [Neorhizobium galegae]MCQ1849665.1 aldehyde dehydrogenase family protein [Neorhizobium galegae]